MKVYHIDTANGEYDTVTEEELKHIKVYWQDDEIKEVNCTEWDLTKARDFMTKEEWRNGWEDEFGTQPSIIDLLEYWNK